MQGSIHVSQRSLQASIRGTWILSRVATTARGGGEDVSTRLRRFAHQSVPSSELLANTTQRPRLLSGQQAIKCANLKDYSPTTCQQFCSSLRARWGRMQSSYRWRPDQQLRSFLRARQGCYRSAFSRLHCPQRGPLSSRNHGDYCPPFRLAWAHLSSAQHIHIEPTHLYY